MSFQFSVASKRVTTFSTDGVNCEYLKSHLMQALILLLFLCAGDQRRRALNSSQIRDVLGSDLSDAGDIEELQRLAAQEMGGSSSRTVEEEADTAARLTLQATGTLRAELSINHVKGEKGGEER